MSNEKNEIKPFGRPVGTGKWGYSVLKTHRYSMALILWIKENGNREYLENLVPKDFRDKVNQQYENKYTDQ